MKEYMNFPKFMLLSDVFTALSQHLMPFLLTIISSAGVAGLFVMGQRLTRIPVLLLGNSVTTVFRKIANEEYQAKGRSDRIFRKTFEKLLWMGVFPYIILAVIAPYLFKFIFGSEWLEAGYFARLLCIGIGVEFLTQPFHSVYQIYGKQRLFLIIQASGSLLSISSLIITWYLTNNIYKSFLFYSIGLAITSLIILRVSYILAKGNKNDHRLPKMLL